jgi:hypothetical protein
MSEHISTTAAAPNFASYECAIKAAQDTLSAIGFGTTPTIATTGYFSVSSKVYTAHDELVKAIDTYLADQKPSGYVQLARCKDITIAQGNELVKLTSLKNNDVIHSLELVVKYSDESKNSSVTQNTCTTTLRVIPCFDGWQLVMLKTNVANFTGSKPCVWDDISYRSSVNPFKRLVYRRIWEQAPIQALRTVCFGLIAASQDE